MHGSPAAAFAPALALLSQPSYMSLAVISAIGVIVYEIRKLLRGIFSALASSASQRTARRATLLSVAETPQGARGLGPGRDNATGFETAALDEHRSLARAVAPGIVMNAAAPRQPPEREPMYEAPPPYLRNVLTARLEHASALVPSIALGPDDHPARIEREAADANVTTPDAATSQARRSDVRQVTLADGRPIELQTMSRDDRLPMMAFARALPARARLALPVDITSPATLDAWVLAESEARTHTVVAYQDAKLVGYANLRRDGAPWMQRVGEISIVLGSPRENAEVGEYLGREIVAVALDLRLRKITARMTRDDIAARAIFEALGFSVEALLADHLIDGEGCTHDLLMLSRVLRPPLALVLWEPPAIAATGQSEIARRPQRQAPSGPPPRIAAAAGVALGPASRVVSTERSVAACYSEVIRSEGDASPAEPPLVAQPAGPASDPPSATASGEESASDRVRAAFPRETTRPTLSRRAYVVAAVVGAVLVLALGGYLTNRHNSSTNVRVLGVSARPTVSVTSAGGTVFASTHTGSGGVFLPVVRPAMAVRVSVDPGVAVTWFWCVESSFGLPLAAHYCATADSSQPGPGGLVTQGVLRIDPAWPVDAAYFVQMYCEGSCVWHVQLVSE